MKEPNISSDVPMDNIDKMQDCDAEDCETTYDEGHRAELPKGCLSLKEIVKEARKEFLAQKNAGKNRK
jgi:hypothetical protein